MKPKLPNTLYRRQFIGLLIFGFLLIAFETGFAYYKNHLSAKMPEVEFKTEEELSTPLILSEFNPNDLDEKQWENLGFSEKQVKTILNYKNVVGGNFKSKEQFKKCYAVSDEKFKKLEPYILLPETNFEAKNFKNNFHPYEKKELQVPGKFNPDLLSAAAWEKMGFSENQANAILKYKNYLGGSFVSKEKFKECFIISEDNYRKLAPYLILPEKTPENYSRFTNKSFKEKPAIQYKIFDPNLLDVAGWQSLGFSEKQANVIVNYRERNLRGSFRTLEDIQKCFVINDEKFEEMKPFIRLDPENFKTVQPAKSYASNSPSSSTVTPTTVKDAEPETKTDFSKIDLNQISFKHLREFGFAEKDAAMMLSFRKKLGGFVNKNQVTETYEIDRVLAEKLIAVTSLNAASVPKYTLVDAPEDWLKNHPYFKYSADKIIFYRITNPDEKKIWKFLKLKPEYEARMRLYLKN